MQEQIQMGEGGPENPGERGNTPQLSLLQTLIDIFLEPSKVFEDLRRYPRFLVAALIPAILVGAFGFFFIQKVGMQRVVKEQLESPFMQQIPEDQKKKMLEDAKETSIPAQLLQNSFGVIAFLIAFVICALLYWGGANAMGGSANFWHALSVTFYSLMPPTLIVMVGNLIVLFLKAAEEISLADSQRGLIKLNPGFFIDGKASPVLATLLGSIDVFQIWGLILAAIGLKAVAKISSGSAWGVVLTVFLIGLAIRVAGALLFGAAM